VRIGVGRVVIDANNYYPTRDGHFPELDDDTTTSTELLAAHLPGAHVVKAFNTMFWELLRDRGTQAPRDERLAILLAGDDQDAKDRVSGLIEEIGFAPVDTGGLAEGSRRQQPGAAAYGNPSTAREAERMLA
jgi:predicted dinucleotide-binding enzyme